jgi:hypothetical protein
VNDLAVDCCVEAFEVRNLQGANGLDRHHERFISLTVLPEGLSRRPENSKDLGPIEPLTFTMLAEAHSREFISKSSARR